MAFAADQSAIGIGTTESVTLSTSRHAPPFAGRPLRGRPAAELVRRVELRERRVGEIDRAQVRQWAIAIVKEVEPDDAFVVEDGYDGLVDAWHRADAQDEGRLVGGIDAATFAAMVVPFLLGFFGDVAKDVVKDQVKTVVGDLLDRVLKRRATRGDAEALGVAVEAAIAKSRFSPVEKARLRTGFDRMLAKLKPTE